MYKWKVIKPKREMSGLLTRTHSETSNVHPPSPPTNLRRRHRRRPLIRPRRPSPIVVPDRIPSFPPRGGFFLAEFGIWWFDRSCLDCASLALSARLCESFWPWFGGKIASLPQKNGESVGVAGDERPADRSWLGDEFGDLRHPESRSWVTFYSLIFLSFWSLLLLNLRFSSSLLLLWVLDWFVRWYGKFMSKNFILPDWIYFFM